MTDKKISQLTNATTPLAGTEVLPIVQSGSTVKVSVDNLTAGKTVKATTFDTDVAAAKVTLSGTTLAASGTDTNISVTVTPKGTGNLVLTSGNLVVANSAGVDFSATPGTGTSELLADYEEGTFTPTVIGTTSAGIATYANQLGKYTKVGRLVTVEIYLNWNTGTGTGNLVFGGLPFTIGSNVYGSAPIWGEIALTASNYLTTRLLAGGTTIDPFNSPVGGGVTNPVNYVTDGAVMITATYFV